MLLSLLGLIRSANANSVVSVYQEAAALGQFPYLSEKRSVFAALVALRPQIRKLSRFPVRRIIDRELRRLRSIFGLFSRRGEGSSSFRIRLNGSGCEGMIYLPQNT